MPSAARSEKDVRVSAPTAHSEQQAVSRVGGRARVGAVRGRCWRGTRGGSEPGCPPKECARANARQASPDRPPRHTGGSPRPVRSALPGMLGRLPPLGATRVGTSAAGGILATPRGRRRGGRPRPADGEAAGTHRSPVLTPSIGIGIGIGLVPGSRGLATRPTSQPDRQQSRLLRVVPASATPSSWPTGDVRGLRVLR